MLNHEFGPSKYLIRYVYIRCLLRRQRQDMTRQSLKRVHANFHLFGTLSRTNFILCLLCRISSIISNTSFFFFAVQHGSKQSCNYTSWCWQRCHTECPYSCWVWCSRAEVHGIEHCCFCSRFRIMVPACPIWNFSSEYAFVNFLGGMLTIIFL